MDSVSSFVKLALHFYGIAKRTDCTCPKIKLNPALGYFNVKSKICFIFLLILMLKFFICKQFHFCWCVMPRGKHPGKEISFKGEGVLPLVQLPISFFIRCIEKHNFYFLLFQQLSLLLIDYCKSGDAHSHCIGIFLIQAVQNT